MKSLDELDAVPWADLHHAYGPAVDVPDLLRALASPAEAPPEIRVAAGRKSVRDHVEWTLWGNVFHQGSRWQASAHVVPFLTQMLADASDDDVDLRRFLVDYLGGLALGYPTDEFDGPFDPDRRFAAAAGRTEPGGEPDFDGDLEVLAAIWERDAYEAVERDIEVIAERATDADERVACEALALLAWFPRRAPVVAPLLRRVACDLGGVRSGHAIVSLACVDPEGVGLARELVRQGDADLTLAAACAVALADPGGLDDVVIDCFGCEFRTVVDRPWAHTGSIGELISRSLERLSSEDLQRVVDSIVHRCLSAAPRDQHRFARCLLQIVFPRRTVPERVDLLNQAQRRACEWIRDQPAFFHRLELAVLLRRWRIPGSPDAWAAWLDGEDVELPPLLVPGKVGAGPAEPHSGHDPHRGAQVAPRRFAGVHAALFERLPGRLRRLGWRGSLARFYDRWRGS